MTLTFNDRPLLSYEPLRNNDHKHKQRRCESGLSCHRIYIQTPIWEGWKAPIEVMAGCSNLQARRADKVIMTHWYVERGWLIQSIWSLPEVTSDHQGSSPSAQAIYLFIIFKASKRTSHKGSVCKWAAFFPAIMKVLFVLRTALAQNISSYNESDDVDMVFLIHYEILAGSLWKQGLMRTYSKEDKSAHGDPL